MRPLFLCLLLSLFACQKDNLPVDQTPISVTDVAGVAQMNQILAWKIFTQEKSAKPAENVLLSPFSIQTAMLMAINGAHGKTSDELLSVMNCSGCDIQEINPLHQDLTTLLTQQSGQPQVTVANHYFYDADRIAVKSPFLEAINTYYNCDASNLSFQNEVLALNQINGWVKSNTQQKIDAILDRITSDDVAFLINALHFKADWAIGFDEELTASLPFTKEDGQQVTVDFVNADRDFAFVQNQVHNMVDIPFQDSTYSLSFIQPAATNKDVDWALTMDDVIYKSLLDQLTVDRAMVFFPRLKLAYENDLIQSLKNLGVQDAFSDRDADFTLMGTANQNIFINQIKHKAILEVDEHGAEGAAVTSIGFGITSAPPTIKFDRPFILVLRHIATQTPLFIGYVADPAF
ncbi:MAG: hypothetical protein K9I85_06240 [Saprospiraceae bacterium]|nr:hypothetical protein [Saprospiraceae bacterium]